MQRNDTAILSFGNWEIGENGKFRGREVFETRDKGEAERRRHEKEYISKKKKKKEKKKKRWSETGEMDFDRGAFVCDGKRNKSVTSCSKLVQKGLLYLW